MARDNGGIIGPANNPTSSTASGVWDLPAQYQAISGGNWPPIPTIAANSLRFNDGSSDYLSRTFSTPTSDKIFTFSSWVKRSGLGSTVMLISAGSDGSNECNIRFVDEKLQFAQDVGGSAEFNIQTTAVFRDVSAWYHIVVAVDTSQATSSDRVKMYVNGVQQTVGGTYPSQNIDTLINASASHSIGKRNYDSAQYFDGYMSEVIFVDGTALDPTSFGQFNANGIWTPIPIGISSYGTNGFRLKFENSASLGLDSSPNGNNFTVNNLTSIDQSTDIPTNNFATLNPLAAQGGSSSGPSGVTFSNGNLEVGSVVGETAIGNLGVDTGKWFWEVKVLTDQDGLTIGGANQYYNLDAELGYNSPSSPAEAKVFGYYGGNGNKFITVGDGSQFTGYGSAIAVNDIVGVALDLDGNQVTFYLNGSSQGTFSITALGSGELYFPAVGNWSASAITTSFNFGNPPYTISSGNSDANDYGNFEYAVPSGYYALCTKNLAEFG